MNEVQPIDKEQKNELVYDTEFLNNKEYVKLLKANSIIRGRVVSDNNKMKLNVYDLKVLNFLLKTLQECIKNEGKPKDFTTLIIPMEIFKRVVDDSKNWRTNFIKATEKLEKIAFELNNYKNWDKDEFVYWQKTRLVINPKFYTKNKERINAYCKISFPQELTIACWQKTDYTHLDFKTINTFKSKYALRFYESLIAKIQYFTNYNNYKTEYDFRQKELENIFELDLSVLPNGFKFFLENRVDFFNTIVNDLKTKINFTYEIYSKDRIITFKIEPNELEQFRTKKNDIVDLSIMKFRNMLESELVNEEPNQRTYKLDKNKPENAMSIFLNDIRKNYNDTPLLQTKEEKEKFGNIAMSLNGNLYFLHNFQVLSYAKTKGFLIYLYKNHYERIMHEIKIKNIQFYKNEEKSLFDNV